MTMIGRRIYQVPDGDGWVYSLCEPGDYFKDANGEWRGQTPNGLYVWLKNHEVVEHEDGTVTVPMTKTGGGANSILASGGAGGKSWHGWIDRSVWKEV